MEFACNVSPVVRLREPQPCRRSDLRVVPVLLGMGRRAGMVCASVLVAVEVTAEDGAKDGR